MPCPPSHRVRRKRHCRVPTYLKSAISITGAKGFEPLNGWTKTSCLTTWRRPNVLTLTILTSGCGNLSSTLTKKF